MSVRISSKNDKNENPSSIILQPYLLKKIGILRDRCLLQIDNIKLSCIPFRLSPGNCTVLLVLSKREQELLRDKEYSNITFHMEVIPEGFKKTWALFFRSRIAKFHEFNLKHNQCLLTLDFISIPVDYQEVLDIYHAKRDENLRKYGSLSYINRKFSFPDLTSISLDKYITLQFNGEEKRRGRLIDFSIDKISLAIDITEDRLRADKNILIEVFTADDVIPISSKLLNYVPAKDIPGLYLVQLKLEFSLCYVELISPLYG